jgi:hypothetical protein
VTNEKANRKTVSAFHPKLELSLPQRIEKKSFYFHPDMFAIDFDGNEQRKKCNLTKREKSFRCVIKIISCCGGELIPEKEKTNTFSHLKCLRIRKRRKKSLFYVPVRRLSFPTAVFKPRVEIKG